MVTSFCSRLSLYRVLPRLGEAGYYQALYLKERTVHEMIVQICRKQNMNPESVACALHIKPGGLKIILDDVVEQLPDGQDMMVEYSRTLKSNAPGVDAEVEIILKF